jgi:hypothetical protein
MTDILLKSHNNRVLISEFNLKWEAAYKPRGRVAGFTYFSKARLSLLLSSFKSFPFVGFWALTFKDAPSAEFAKKELKRITMVFNRRKIGWLWVMEFQQRGAIHFHFLLTEYVSQKWLTSIWQNGHVSATKVWHEDGLRNYLLKEISKNNQKRAHGFSGRWWGVSRHLNKKYSLGLMDEHCLAELVDKTGFKQFFWREDFDKIGIDLTKYEL